MQVEKLYGIMQYKNNKQGENIMNTSIGLLLVGLSLLTYAVVVSIGQVLKVIILELPEGSGKSSVLNEIPAYVYLVIMIVGFIGILIIFIR
jgi:hypothetical protein